MKMKKLLIGMFPFLFANQTLKANDVSGGVIPFRHINQDFGNSQNGYHFASKNNRKHKKNMLHVSKKVKLRHKISKKSA